jgi:GNAT superfamily N-acetyltransferase
LDSVADDEPLSVAALGDYAGSGHSWVVIDDDDTPVGYVLVDVVDGCAHIEQLSVQPDQQGQGAGRALVDRVAVWAVEMGMPAITLTTFAAVDWNRPLFEHLGFRVIDEAELGPGLRAIRHAEAGRGLDPSLRVCMIKDLSVRDSPPAAPP